MKKQKAKKPVPMRVEHSLTVIARCPVNNARDVYEATFRVSCLVPVENIVKHCLEYQDRKLFQEELTQLLAETFHCEVETHGQHGEVRTKVVCGDAA